MTKKILWNLTSKQCGTDHETMFNVGSKMARIFNMIDKLSTEFSIVLNNSAFTIPSKHVRVNACSYIKDSELMYEAGLKIDKNSDARIDNDCTFKELRQRPRIIFNTSTCENPQQFVNCLSDMVIDLFHDIKDHQINTSLDASLTRSENGEPPHVDIVYIINLSDSTEYDDMIKIIIPMNKNVLEHYWWIH